MIRFRFLLPLLAVLLVAACSDEDKAGPEDVVWDRDVCELCKMAISDAGYVAEVRGGPKRRLHHFDDVGCAILWLNDKPWAAAPETEIWVAERSASTREKVTWLDAHKAFYVEGVLSPMNYGFAAQAEQTEGSLTFKQVTDRVIAHGPNHICPAPR